MTYELTNNNYNIHNHTKNKMNVFKMNVNFNKICQIYRTKN